MRPRNKDLGRVSRPVLSMPWLFVCAAIPGACCAVTVLALQAVVTRKSAHEAEPELRAGKMSRPAFRSGSAEIEILR
jgi:hypothetical protein